MKCAIDKVTRDLSQVALIEATLKAKKYDTSKMQEYLKNEADSIAAKKDALFERWVLLKQDAHETMTVTDMQEKAAAANLMTRAVLDAFKVFAKETLSEFRK